MIDDTLGTTFERLGIVSRPPIAQIAARIKTAAFIVKAMGQLMSNGPTGIPVIRGIVQRSVIKWRLKDAGRKIDIVHLRIVISIHGGRRHQPLTSVYRLTNLGHLPRGLETHRPIQVSKEIIRPNLEV